MSGGFGRHRRQRNWGARAQAVTRDGLDLVIIENEQVRLGWLAGKGADLVEWLYKPLDLDLVWLSPGGITDPAGGPATAPDAVASILDAYPGGWQTVFPNGGAPATVAGAAFGQHGEACLLLWDAWLEQDTEQVVEVRFATRLRRMPFRLERTVRLERNQAAFTLIERATSLAAVPLPAMWGQHITFGPPFLDASCRIRTAEGLTVTPHADTLFPAGRRVANTAPFPWPRSGGAAHSGADGVAFDRLPEPGTASEMLYLSGFGDHGWYAIEHPGRGVVARIGWDATIQPLLWYWQEFGATVGWPWFGQAYVIGLEPFAGFPTDGLAAAVGNGSALTFAPGETKTIRLQAEVGRMERAGGEQ